MDWERIDATIRSAVRKRGAGGAFHDVVDPGLARTPLSDLIEKEPLPELSAMTDAQLCELAAHNHIAIAEDLSRAELVDAIVASLEKNWEERVRGMTATLDYFFADGPHPLAVFRRAAAVAKAVRPKLIFDMSCADLAVLCNDGHGAGGCDGRATVSARIDRIFSAPIKKAGMHGSKAGFQKTASAAESYSAAAAGNQNRLGGAYLAEKKRQQQPNKKAA